MTFCAHCGGSTMVTADQSQCSCGFTAAGRARIEEMGKVYDRVMADCDAACQRVDELQSTLDRYHIEHPTICYQCACELGPGQTEAKSVVELRQRIAELETKLDALATTSKSVIAGLEAQLRDAKLADRSAEESEKDLETLRGDSRLRDTMIEVARQAYVELEKERSVLISGLKAVRDLINGSHGVSGLHQNGDVAPWHELREGGRFESWLLDFDKALAAFERLQRKEKA